jgi:hypothetical protein
MSGNDHAHPAEEIAYSEEPLRQLLFTLAASSIAVVACIARALLSI